jgi:hypothetical protein
VVVSYTCNPSLSHIFSHTCIWSHTLPLPDESSHISTQLSAPYWTAGCISRQTACFGIGFTHLAALSSLLLQPGLGITIRVESYSADRSSVTVSVCRQGGGQDYSTRATPPYLGSRKIQL